MSDFDAKVTFSADAEEVLGKLRDLEQATTRFGGASDEAQAQVHAAIGKTEESVQSLKGRLVELYAQRSQGDQTQALQAEIKLTEQSVQKLTEEAKNLKSVMAAPADSNASVAGVSADHIMEMALGFGTLAGAANMAIGKIVEIGKDIINAFPEAIARVNEMARTFESLSYQTGESLENLNVLRAGMNLTGGTVQDLEGWMKGATRSMKANADMLVENGVAGSKSALMAMPFTDYLRKVMELAETIQEPFRKSAFLTEALGRAGMEAAPQIRRLLENMENAKDTLDTFGGKVDENGIKKMQDFERVLGEVKTAQEAVDQQLALSGGKWVLSLKTMSVGFSQFADSILGGQSKIKNALANMGLNVFGGQTLADAKTAKMLEKLKAESAASDDTNAVEGKGVTKIDVPKQKPVQTKEEVDAANEASKEAAKTAQEAKQKEEQEAKEAQDVLNSLQAQMNRLKTEDLQTSESVTLEQKKEKDIALALAKLEEENRRADADLAKSPKSGKNQDEAAKVKAEALAVYQDRSAQIQLQFDQSRKAAEEKIQAELDQIQGQGLDKRIAAIKVHCAKMLEEIKNGSDKTHTAEQVAAAQSIAIEHETAKITEEDTGKIRKELERLAKESGAPLTVAESLAALESEAIKNKSPQAIAEIRAELERTKDGSAGFASGLKQVQVESENSFGQWESFAKSSLDGVGNALSKLCTDGLTQHKNFGQQVKSVWSDLSRSVIADLVKMEAKELEGDAAKKLRAAWTGTAAKEDIALTKEKTVATQLDTTANVTGSSETVAASEAETSAANTSTDANLEDATSGFFSAYASIPWVGIAMALAGVAVMKGVMSSVTAHAVGGVIDHPTLSLMGEAGTEIVMPETSFQDYFQGTLQMGASLAQANQSTQQTVNHYNNLGASYATAAAQASRPGGGSQGDNHTHIHLEGSTIMGDSQESTRLIGRNLKKIQDDYNRRQG